MFVAVTSSLLLLRELFTIRGAGTLIKRGSTIVVKYGLAEVDAERLSALLTSSFGRELEPAFFDRDMGRAYIEESYRGVALVRETPLGGYLCKLAVDREAQGEGLGRDLWQLVRRRLSDALLADAQRQPHPPVLLARVRRHGPDGEMAHLLEGARRRSAFRKPLRPPSSSRSISRRASERGRRSKCGAVGAKSPLLRGISCRLETRPFGAKFVAFFGRVETVPPSALLTSHAWFALLSGPPCAGCARKDEPAPPPAASNPSSSCHPNRRCRPSSGRTRRTGSEWKVAARCARPATRSRPRQATPRTPKPPSITSVRRAAARSKPTFNVGLRNFPTSRPTT